MQQNWHIVAQCLLAKYHENNTTEIPVQSGHCISNNFFIKHNLTEKKICSRETTLDLLTANYLIVSLSKNIKWIRGIGRI